MSSDRAKSDGSRSVPDSPTQEVWCRDLNGVAASLSAHVIVRDGREYIDPTDAPTGLVDLYRGLVSVGYARGWL